MRILLIQVSFYRQEIYMLLLFSTSQNDFHSVDGAICNGRLPDDFYLRQSAVRVHIEWYHILPNAYFPWNSLALTLCIIPLKISSIPSILLE